MQRFKRRNRIKRAMASQPNLAVIHRCPMAIRSQKSTSLKQQHQIFSFRVGFEKQMLSAQRFLGVVWVDKHYLWWLVNSCLDQSYQTLTSTNHNSSFSTQKIPEIIALQACPHSPSSFWSGQGIICAETIFTASVTKLTNLDVCLKRLNEWWSTHGLRFDNVIIKQQLYIIHSRENGYTLISKAIEEIEIR